MWAAALIVVIALVGGIYVYLHLDDQIRQHVERLFADHYKTLVVEVGSARFEQGRGVFIDNLTLLQPGPGDAPIPVLAIDELFLASESRLDEILSGKLSVKEILVSRPRLRAVLQSDGHWNVSSLVPLPKFSDDAPIVSITDATLLLEDAARNPGMPLSLRGIDIQLKPIKPGAAGVANAPRALELCGTISGAPARKIALSGSLSPDDSALDISIEVAGLEMSPELIAGIPGSLVEQAQGCELYAAVDASVHVIRSPGSNSPLSWSADVAVSRGRLGHPLLPQPITELNARIEADQKLLAVKQLTGKLGSADIALACNRNGWGARSPLGISGKIVGLVVSDDLPTALPEKLARLWRRFQPLGTVDAEIQATFDGQEWRPELVAHCRGISLTDAEKFPYPLSGATGTVSLIRPDVHGPIQLQLDLVGMAEGRPIHITAQMDRLSMPRISVASQGAAGSVTWDESPVESRGVYQAKAEGIVEGQSKPTGWVEVSGTGVSIHSQLLAALPPRAQLFVRSLHPQGTFDFRWRFERLDPNSPRGDTALDLTLVDCAMQYDRFAYPLEQVRGTVNARNGRFTLTNLVGRDRQGSAVVTLEGEAESTGDGLALALAIRGTNVPLDDNLRLALSAREQQVWADLRPQGRVNFLADVRRQIGDVKPAIRVEVQPQENSVSVEPTFFPYRFEQVAGRATITDGRVELHQLRGIHGRTSFSANGTWQSDTTGGWRLELTGASADRLTFDTDLMRAVPPGVQKVIDRIRPTGNLNAYDSTLRFNRRAGAQQIESNWDIQLACLQTSLRGDLPLESLTGSIRLLGSSDGANVVSYGELDIDSLVWNDMQFTNLRGPFWSDGSVCYLGQQATTQLAQPPRRVTADLYGGSLAADVTLQHANQTSYNAQISLGGLDLGRFARERLGGPNDLTGIVSGQLRLASAGRSIYALTGTGDLHVVDANIYQLPPLVALLSVLRNRIPKSTAFNRCDAQFDIRGEHIHFNQLNLLGDVINLYGRGETNFDRRLDLTFYTLLGPQVPLLKTVVGHLSEQGLQLKVDGTWDNPQIHREAFPMINQVLTELQNGAQQGAAVVAPPAAAGIPWVTPPR